MDIFEVKKLLEIIPRNYFRILEIPARISHNRISSSSPGGTTANLITDKKPNTFRRSIRNEILLPVLSTAGTHEERSKIYKYK